MTALNAAMTHKRERKKGEEYKEESDCTNEVHEEQKKKFEGRQMETYE